MANYGITNTNQIIDIATIKTGCNTLLEAIEDFKASAKKVLEASELCGKKALEVNDKEYTTSIAEIGNKLNEIANTYTQVVNQIQQDAQRVYNNQVAEYNSYVAEQEKQKSENK